MMMCRSLVFGAVLLSLLTAASPAHAADGLVEVADGWSFRPGDSPLDAQGLPVWISEATPTADWRPLKALTSPEGDAHGLVWIRIPLPTGDWRDATLFIASMQGASAEFYTRRKIFEVGKINPSGAEEPRADSWTMVPVPHEDLGHPIYIRLQQSPHPTGFRKAVRMGERSDFIYQMLGRAIPSVMVTGILLLLALITLIGFLVRRADVYLFYCSMFALCASALVLGISEAQNLIYNSARFWSAAILVGAFMMLPALAAFIAATILTESNKRMSQLVKIGLFVPASLMSLAVCVDPHFTQKYLPFILLFIMGGLLTNVVIGVREAMRGNVDAQIFSAGIAVFFSCVAYDSMSVLGVVSSEGFNSHLGFLAVTLALVMVVVRRHLLMSASLEQHMKESEKRHATMSRLSSRLSDSARILVGAVARLRKSSDVQNGLVDQQAATMQEILATAQEINQASRIAAEKAKEIMGSASRADEANQSIGRAVDEGLGGISTVATEVAEMANRIRALEQRTRQISGIVDTVKDLADQSNMLALNAAIEAMRSGESGKGFVVVAREMRSLADLSLQATVRIREVLASANDGIREAADLSVRGEARIHQSLKQLQGSGTQLRALGQIVQDSNSNVRQISAAIGQQSAGVSQVFVALNDFNQQMTETVERLKETREAAGSVESVADAMSAALEESGGPEVATPAPAMDRQAA